VRATGVGRRFWEQKVFGTPRLMAIVAEVCTYTFPTKGFQHEID
jgi:hypothetical protein